MKAQTWQNWGGNVKARPSKFKKPKTIEKLRSHLSKAAKKGQVARVVGSGHSWTRLCKTDDLLLSLDNLAGIESINKESGIVSVYAGTKLKDFNAALFENGLAMENLGDIDVQSLAGAISTGTHGTGISFGNLGTQVTELTLMKADGEILVCSETENHDIFKAAQVSLGALGVILKYKVKCLPAYKLHFIEKKESVEDCLDNLYEHIYSNRNFEFYWFPYTDVTQLKISNTTEQEVKDNSMVNYVVNDVLLENVLFGGMARMAKYVSMANKAVAKISGAAVSEGEKVNWSHKVYATPRWVKFNEMEYNIPLANFKEAFLEIKSVFEDKQFKVHFPTENRFVKGDDIYLSPAYQRDSAYIAAHVFKGKEYRSYFDTLSAIFKNHQGRPHWGKMHFLSGEELRELYPKWDDFQQIRTMLDPQGMFLNPYLRKLFLVDKKVKTQVPVS